MSWTETTTQRKRQLGKKWHTKIEKLRYSYVVSQSLRQYPS